MLSKVRSGTVHAPSVVIWVCDNTTKTKDCLAFDIGFPSRREDRAIRNHQVFGYFWVGYYDEQLAAYPDGIESAVFMCPFV